MRETADGPVQWVDAGHVPHLEIIDLSAEPAPEATARAAVTRDRRSPVDPARDRLALQRLYVLGGGRYVWYLRVHHLATDGYGMALLTERVCALYADPSSGTAFAPLDGVLAEDAVYRTSETVSYTHLTLPTKRIV